MTTIPKSPIHIVVGYDFSDSAQLCLSRAFGFAEAEPRHLLHILAVMNDKHDFRPHPTGKIDYDAAMEAQELLTRELEARLKLTRPGTDIHFFVHARLGQPAAELLRLAEEVGAHLILVGSHGRTGIKRVLMGSVSEEVVRKARCPVLVVRDREYEDVALEHIVDAPPDHADKDPYVAPHRYSYTNQMMQRQTASWPWY